jgi:hypothetical protein
MRYSTSPQLAAAGDHSVQIVIDMTGSRYYIREDSDIDEIATKISKKLKKELDKKSRIRG